MTYKLVSIKRLISKVFRDTKLTDDSAIYDMIEWAAEAMGFIGVGAIFNNRSDTFQVKDYVTGIPCQLEQIIGIKYCGKELVHMTGEFDTLGHYMKTGNTHGTTMLNGYKPENGYLLYNFREGEVEISYTMIAVDNEGYPLIVDNVSVLEAISRYIVYKMNYGKYLSGTMDVRLFSKLENDWRLYCGQAKGALNSPSISELTNIKNIWLAKIPRINMEETMGVATRDNTKHDEIDSMPTLDTLKVNTLVTAYVNGN